jgi:hypothetical protein
MTEDRGQMTEVRGQIAEDSDLQFVFCHLFSVFCPLTFEN